MNVESKALSAIGKCIELVTATEDPSPKDIILAKKLFQQELNKPPIKSYIKKDKFTKTDYIPIGYIEGMLDGYFLGQWSIQEVKAIRVENEILLTLELCVVNPITGQVRCIAGAASGQIGVYKYDSGKTKQRKGEYSRDMDNKIPNTLEKDFPAIKAMAVKNAAKSLGKRFGRDLNRKDTLERNPNEITDSEADILNNL